MKNIITIVAAIVIAWFVWHLIGGLIGGALALVFQIAMLGLFCYVVYLVYKALNRQKI